VDHETLKTIGVVMGVLTAVWAAVRFAFWPRAEAAIRSTVSKEIARIEALEHRSAVIETRLDRKRERLATLEGRVATHDALLTAIPELRSSLASVERQMGTALEHQSEILKQLREVYVEVGELRGELRARGHG
jgi:chromosome segregation ATPase